MSHRIHSVKSKSKQSYNMGTSGSPSCTSTICNSSKGLKRKMQGTNRNMPKLYHSILLNIDCTCHALSHLPHDKFGQALLCPLLLAVFFSSSLPISSTQMRSPMNIMSIGHHWTTSQGFSRPICILSNAIYKRHQATLQAIFSPSPMCGSC